MQKRNKARQKERGVYLREAVLEPLDERGLGGRRKSLSVVRASERERESNRARARESERETVCVSE